MLSSLLKTVITLSYCSGPYHVINNASQVQYRLCRRCKRGPNQPTDQMSRRKVQKRSRCAVEVLSSWGLLENLSVECLIVKQK